MYLNSHSNHGPIHPLPSAPFHREYEYPPEKGPTFEEMMDVTGTADLDDFRKGTEKQRADFCSNILCMFAKQGFAKFVNHGLDENYVRQGFDYSKKLFELDHPTKMAFAHPPRPNPHRGYSYVGQENISAISGFERGEDSTASIVDLKESFDCGAPENKLNPNVWPQEEDIPGFKEYMLGYYEKCYRLQLEIMSALAISLDLPEDTFDTLHDKRASELRMIHYLEVPEEQVHHQDKTRIAEHTDFGTLTLLMQDGSGGLQIQDPATRTWSPVGCQFPTLIANVGDSMMRWMNKRIHSACHRVPLTAEAINKDIGAVPARYSIAFFGKPNPDASLKPMESLVTETYPCQYEDISAYEYDQQKLQRIYLTT